MNSLGSTGLSPLIARRSGAAQLACLLQKARVVFTTLQPSLMSPVRPGTPPSQPGASPRPLRSASLSRRLLGRVLALYVAVSLIIYGLDLTLRYRQIETDIAAELDMLHGVFDQPMSYALWHMDAQQLDFVVGALQRMPSVRRVALVSPDGRVLRDRQVQAPLGRLAQWVQAVPIVQVRALSHLRNGIPVPLGTLRIQSDRRVILDRLSMGLALSALSAMVKSALLVGLFTLYFDRILSRPLTGMAAQAAALRPGRRPMANLPIKPGQPDELDVIARAINSLLGEVDRALAHQAALADGLTQKVAELQQAQSTLIESEKMAALGALVAGVAHEINTPVGLGLTGASHLCYMVDRLEGRLMDGVLQRQDLELFLSDAKELSRSITTSLERAASLVRSFNQVAVDQGHAEQRSFQLALCVGDVALTHGTVLKRAQVRIETRVDPDLHVYGDPGALAQVLSNLINNAVLHGFRVAQAAPVIRVDAQASGREVCLTFSDNGCGMTPDVARRIYEPFFTTARGQGGSGLGMHIVYSLVTQRLRGSIRLETVPGQGTAYRIRLPVDPPGPASSFERQPGLAA